MDASRFPFDYDTMQKGDVIPAERMSELIGEAVGSEGYKLGILRWAEIIMSELAERGNPATVLPQKTGELRVLTDEEASAYHANAFTKRIRGMRRDLDGMRRVDPAVLGEEVRRQHDRRVEIMGKTYQGALSGRRAALKLVAHERQTPGLPAPGGKDAAPDE